MFFQKPIDYIHFDSIDSTHEWAKENISSFHPDRITAITATSQTGGRGRIKKRTWISKEGNFHFTGFFYLPKIMPQITNLSQLVVLTALQFLKKHSLHALIKWPNDLIHDNKKFGGGFLELIDREESWGCILSMGLNVNAPVQADQPTTSLSEISGNTWDLSTLQRDLLELLKQNFTLFCQQGFSPFHSYFQEHLAFIGKPIFCTVGEKKISGIFSGITEEGKLKLLQENDKMLFLSSGEMHTLREIDA